MSITPFSSGERPDPFTEFDRISNQLMERFFSHDPFSSLFSSSFPDHSLLTSWPAPLSHTADFPFFPPPLMDRWETSDSHFVRFRLPDGARAEVDDEGFVTVSVPKREPAPEKGRPNVRVIEIEEKN